MERLKRYVIIKILVTFLILHYSLKGTTFVPDVIMDGKLIGVNSFAELKDSSLFSFSIIGDNHGNSYFSNLYFQRMVSLVDSSKDKFILGTGDHVKRSHTNTFLRFIKVHNLWRKNFYPVVGDGENEVFGYAQEDWGAGKKFLRFIELNKRPNVIMHNNGVDYYAKIPIQKYTIHFIGLHFPDRPLDPEIAFKEESKMFLDSVLNTIQKHPNQIVIAAAHSQYGFWTEYLSKTQYENLIHKCDLVLAGSIHYFEHRILNEINYRGPLILSNGSISEPHFNSKPGFIQVHVLTNNKGLFIEYVDLSKSKRTLSSYPHAFYKSLKGQTFLLNYKNENTPLL